MLVNTVLLLLPRKTQGSNRWIRAPEEEDTKKRKAVVATFFHTMPQIC
jgi:hypothetical protein